MKKHVLTLSLVLALAFVMFIAFAAQMQAEEMVKCPVSGKEINKSEAKETYEYEGKTYYFCCANCKTAFVKNPEKYTGDDDNMGHMHAQQEEKGHEVHMHGKSEDKAKAVKCPVMGHEIKDLEKAPSYEYEGKTYYFCCPGCKEKFMKDPEKYIKKEEDAAHKMHEHNEMKMTKKEGKTCCAMSGMMHSEEIKMSIENTEDGIAVKVTSENPELVKKLQEMGPQMKVMHEKMGSCCKEEAKKKEKKEVKEEKVKK